MVFPYAAWSHPVVAFALLLGYRQHLKALKRVKLRAERCTAPLDPFYLWSIYTLLNSCFYHRFPSWTLRYQTSSTREAGCPNNLLPPSKVWAATRNLSFPCNSNCSPSLSRFHVASSLAGPHPALHLAQSTVVITSLHHHYALVSFNPFSTERQQAGCSNLSHIPWHTTDMTLWNQFIPMLRTQRRVWLLSQWDATERKSPTGSFAFTLARSVVPALAAAKSS